MQNGGESGAGARARAYAKFRWLTKWSTMPGRRGGAGASRTMTVTPPLPPFPSPHHMHTLGQGVPTFIDQVPFALAEPGPPQTATPTQPPTREKFCTRQTSTRLVKPD